MTGINWSEAVIKAKDQQNIQCNADPLVRREEGLSWPAAIPEEKYMSNCAQIVTGHLCNSENELQ